MRIAVSLFMILLMRWGAAQTLPDTVYHLPDAVVEGDRFSLLPVGSLRDSLSLSRAKRYGLSMAAILSENTAVFLREYGPAGLSLASVRGTGAQQMAILWNGLNIQSPMNGQKDLRLLPAFFFEEAEMIYGSSAGLAGSGAIGGTLRLSTAMPARKGWNSDATLSTGSFGKRAAGFSLSYGDAHYRGKLSFYGSGSRNDYPFLNSSINPPAEERMTHARSQQWGMQYQSVILLKKSSLDIHYMHLASDRQLPPGIFENKSEKSQQDAGNYVKLGWKRGNKKHYWHINGGWIGEKINYNDTSLNLYARNRSRSLVFQPDYTLTLNAKWMMRAGFFLRYDRARLNPLSKDVERHEEALLVSWIYTPGRKVMMHLDLRQGKSSQGIHPFIPSLAASLALGKWTVKGKVSRHYREPTLNDLYWQPGGNPQLKPERGWAGDLSLLFEYGNEKHLLSGGLSAYANAMLDQIVWRPAGGSLWRPENVAKSYARGLEWRLQAASLKGHVRFRTGMVLAYTRALRDRWSNELQMAFIPRWNGNAWLQMEYRRWTLSYRHRYSGVRYSDNSNSYPIDAFDLGELECARSFARGKTRMNVYARVSNIWNESYRVMPAYFMPPATFNTGIYLHF